MWNFIKGLFKFVFGTIFTVSLIAALVLCSIRLYLQKDFEEIESKTKEIVSDIETNN